MISIKHVNKKFSIGNKQIHALKDINLDILQGSIFGVIGSSGAGKSTLIRCVNLLEKPSSGDICVDKINLTQLNRTDLTLARRKIGMIFQHFNLLSSRNVFENVALPLELANSNYFNKCKEFPYLCASSFFDFLKKFKFIEKKISQKNIAWIDKGLTSRNEFLARKNKKVRELLKLVGLDDKEHEYPANLSGGQKQRVAIARALASDPKVLLCDEATSALDPATTQSILKLLKEINTRLGITILIITHEMDVVKGICNQVAIIGGGELVETGSVGDIFAHPKTTLAKEFIRSTLDLSVPDDYKARLVQNWSEGKNTLVRLEFTGSSVDEPIISFMCRKYNLDISILSSDMDYAGGVKFGIMLAEIIGNQTDGENAFSYLKEQKVQVEVLGYV